jgi:Transcription factor homologous to NACalpha-BTF3
MEINLEKIELVKDRTGVSYREAKEALEATDGNVVDAIIKIEDEINVKVGTKISDNGAKVIEKIKEAVKKGNVSKIQVKREEEILLNIPVTVGVVGTVLAPWLTVIGSIVALGVKCDIVLLKEDGSIIDLSGKMNDTFTDIKEKTTETAEVVRGKVSEAASAVQDKTDVAKSNLGEIKDIVQTAAHDIKETITSDKEEAAEAVEKAADVVEEAAENAKEDVKEVVEDVVKKAKKTVKAKKDS